MDFELFSGLDLSRVQSDIIKLSRLTSDCFQSMVISDPDCLKLNWMDRVRLV